MAPYRFFYWTDVADKLAKVETVECPDDARAVSRAEEAFRPETPYTVVEIWKDDRLVARRQRLPLQTD